MSNNEKKFFDELKAAMGDDAFDDLLAFQQDEVDHKNEIKLRYVPEAVNVKSVNIKVVEPEPEMEPVVMQKKIDVDMKDIQCIACYNVRPNMMCASACMHPICLTCCGKLVDKTMCPTCKVKAVWIPHAYVNRLTDGLQVQCQWAGCTEKLTLKKYDAHAKDCIHRQLKCKNKDCKWEGSWASYLDHKDKCVYQPETCKNCEGKFTRGSIKLHMPVCPNRIMKCNMCDFTGAAWVVVQHQSDHAEKK